MKVIALCAVLVLAFVAVDAADSFVRKGRADRCDGLCRDIAKPCATHYVAGLCPGAKNIQCCKAKASTPAPAQPPRTQPAPSRPTQPPTPAQPATPTPRPTQPTTPNNGGGKFGSVFFADLLNAYPGGEADEAKARIGGAVNAAWITNTCTIRVSRAMNYAGLKVPSGYKLPKLGATTVLSTVKGGDGNNYAYRVKEMNAYLRAAYGAPTLEITNGRCDGPKEKSMGLEVPESWHSKNGIIRFDVRIWSDASGHFDLWHGSQDGDDDRKCSHECYWSKACAAQLWEIPNFERR